MIPIALILAALAAVLVARRNASPSTDTPPATGSKSSPPAGGSRGAFSNGATFSFKTILLGGVPLGIINVAIPAGVDQHYIGGGSMIKFHGIIRVESDGMYSLTGKIGTFPLFIPRNWSREGRLTKGKSEELAVYNLSVPIPGVGQLDHETIELTPK
jgi:hypothetical protein